MYHHQQQSTSAPAPTSSSLLPPISLILANRVKMMDQLQTSSEGALSTAVSAQQQSEPECIPTSAAATVKHIAHSCPILINGQTMPWPLFTQKQVINQQAVAITKPFFASDDVQKLQATAEKASRDQPMLLMQHDQVV